MLLTLFKKGLSQNDAKSITFTFASQFVANFEMKFLIVYRNCWLRLRLIFQREIRFPENQVFR